MDAIVPPVARAGKLRDGISSRAVTPKSRRTGSRGMMASKVPAGVNVPTWSS